MEHLSRGHLSPETLARLVDEVPSPTERTHLNRCRRCRDELDALQAQTLGLSHLPDLRPPHGDWPSLETRLRSEGLIHPADVPTGVGTAGRQTGAGSTGSSRAARSRQLSGGWQWAAAVLLLLGGAGIGAGAAGALGEGGSGNGGGAAGPYASSTSRDLAAVPVALGLWGEGGPESLEEAEELVRLTESWYRSALLRYREEAARGGDDGGPTGPGQRAPDPGGLPDSRSVATGGAEGEDLLTRYIALEALLAAGQAAIREAPTDPFLNGLLVNMHAEREAALRGMRMVSREEGVWY